MEKHEDALIEKMKDSMSHKSDVSDSNRVMAECSKGIGLQFSGGYECKDLQSTFGLNTQYFSHSTTGYGFRDVSRYYSTI